MITVIFGTRPELIKLAPVIKELDKQQVDHTVINTGQHKEMLMPLLEWFKIKPDFDLSAMRHQQSLNDIVYNVISQLDKIYEQLNPKVVITQGDTTTAFVGSLAAFNRKIKVGHVEAGLRTNNLYNPFPEEANRRLITQIASFHFTPTSLNTTNVINSGVETDKIFETGNTVIDALFYTLEKNKEKETIPPYINEIIESHEKIVTVTGHRRENLGEGFENIFTAIRNVANQNPSYGFIYPVHLNPLVKDASSKILGKTANVYLVEPLDYPAFVSLMSKSHFIVSDSGGVQEEAPSLNIPVLVTRENTERIEVVNIGAVKLVGTKQDSIEMNMMDLINNPEVYNKMINKENPYGDGNASQKIVNILKNVC
jgi:UDP-N-acetylglucosamine 2-epimerase (non-hydrolysing)